MRGLVIVLLSLLFTSHSFSQIKLVEYEYWFNNDYGNVQVISFTPTVQHAINTDLDASALPEGINVLNLRYKDENGIYSSTISQFFYKNTEQLTLNKKLVEYEYWFNNDYGNVQVVPFSPSIQHNINTDLDASALAEGINVLNIRYKDEDGIYGSTISQFFYKNTEQLTPGKKLVEYEYWFNNDYGNVQIVSFTPSVQHSINGTIDASTLPEGINVLNIRYKDENDIHSSTISQFFCKSSATVVDNKIVGYKYWFDNDLNNAVYNLLGTPVTQLNLSNSIDMTQISKGTHTVNFQLLDSVGNWSVVTTDTVIKLSLPIAEFSYLSTENCDSTIVDFTDNSIDGDTYYWDFGDGDHDTITDPQHIFYSPGTYLVNLTITDTITLDDSTYQLPITIYGETTDSIVVSECFEYISPSGIYTYVNSGIYIDTVANNWGCDSVITINLNINSVNIGLSQTGNDLTASASGANYQWLDCDNNYSLIPGETSQTYTPALSGNYAVEVTENGCIDTSSCYQITLVGLEENSDLLNVQIYPNPTRDLLYIDLGKTQDNVRLKLTLADGKTIEYLSIQNTGIVQLDLSDNPSGVYFVEILTDSNKKTVFKVIKQ